MNEVTCMVLTLALAGLAIAAYFAIRWLGDEVVKGAFELETGFEKLGALGSELVDGVGAAAIDIKNLIVPLGEHAVSAIGGGMVQIVTNIQTLINELVALITSTTSDINDVGTDLNGIATDFETDITDIVNPIIALLIDIKNLIS